MKTTLTLLLISIFSINLIAQDATEPRKILLKELI